MALIAGIFNSLNFERVGNLYGLFGMRYLTWTPFIVTIYTNPCIEYPTSCILEYCV